MLVLIAITDYKPTDFDSRLPTCYQENVLTPGVAVSDEARILRELLSLEFLSNEPICDVGPSL